MILGAAQVITPARIFAPGWVHVEGDRILGVGAGEPPYPVDTDLGEVTVVPGLVDAHAHGGGGASYDAGSPEEAAVAARTHLAYGTTSQVASLVSDTPARLADKVRALVPLVEEGLLAGIHLEGPWLSPRHRGAHDLDVLCAPDPAAVDLLLAAGDGAVRMVTLAPELPGGLDAVRRISAGGVMAAIGHTDATYDQARAAVDAGAGAGTHLFNGMRGLHHREPGPVAALLEHPDAYVELIADGVHVHPAMLRLAVNDKPHLSVLVTDAMAAAGAADGDYVLGTLAVRVRDGVARLSEGDAIAGSTLTLSAALRYAVRVAGLPIEVAVRAATATPAAMLGLERVGALRPGHRANLVVLDEELRVSRVLHRGRWVRGQNE